MRKLALFLLCFGLIGGAATSRNAEPLQRICEMEFRKVVILGEGISTKSAFEYANSYKAGVWYKEEISRGPEEKSAAIKDLISELEGINATGEEWEFIIPKIAEEYLLSTLKNMDDSSLSNARGTVYLSESSMNDKSIENEIQRVSGGSFVVECWLLDSRVLK